MLSLLGSFFSCSSIMMWCGRVKHWRDEPITH